MNKDCYNLSSYRLWLPYSSIAEDEKIVKQQLNYKLIWFPELTWSYGSWWKWRLTFHSVRIIPLILVFSSGSELLPSPHAILPSTRSLPPRLVIIITTATNHHHRHLHGAHNHQQQHFSLMFCSALSLFPQRYDDCNYFTGVCSQFSLSKQS